MTRALVVCGGFFLLSSAASMRAQSSNQPPSVPAADKLPVPFMLDPLSRDSLGPRPAASVRLYRPSPQPVGAQSSRSASGLQPYTTYNPNCSPSTMTYYGGPLVSNVQVVVVYWNADVNASIQATIPNFFKGITNSQFIDQLSEWSTDFAISGPHPSTNQSVGRGGLLGAYTIVPRVCAAQSGSATCNLTDAQLETELLAEVSSGKLPAQQFDSQGYPTTYYSVYFPPYISLTDPNNAHSCVDFCAYHGAAGSASNALLYGANMDNFTSSCAGVCGDVGLRGQEKTSSHELAETISDAFVGFATQLAYPLAWYSNSCGEIGDSCNDAGSYLIPTPQGEFYIQPEWSNKLNTCTIGGVEPLLSLSGPTTLPLGTAGSYTLTVLNPAGGMGTNTSFVGTIAFSSSDPRATLPANYNFTAADKGTINFSATFATPASQTLVATDTINNTISTTDNVTVTQQSDSTSLSVMPSSGVAADQPVMLSATVLPAASTGTVVFTDNGAAISGPIVPVNGTANFTLNSIPAGSNRFVATFTGSGAFINSASTAQTVTATAATFSSLVVSETTAAHNGLPAMFSVTARDTNGYAFAAFTGTVSFASSDPRAALPSAYTFTSADAGVHAFSLTLGTAGSQTVTASSGSVSGTAAGVSVDDVVAVANGNGSVGLVAETGVTESAGAAGSGAAAGLAVDSSGNSWTVLTAANQLVAASRTGSALSGSPYTGGGLTAPSGVAIDGLGQVWVANGNKTVSVFSNAGAAVSGAKGYSTGTAAGPSTAISVDRSGSVWVASQGAAGGVVTQILGAAVPVVPLAVGVSNGTTGSRP